MLAARNVCIANNNLTHKVTAMPFRSNPSLSLPLTRRCVCLVAALGLSALWIPECGAADPAAASAAQAVPSGASVDSESGTISLIDQKNAIVVVTVPGR